MTGRPIARRSRAPLPGRRTRPVRRASAGLSAIRAGAALALLASVAGIYGVGTSSAFDYKHLQVDGVHFTDENAVEAAISVARGENLFRLETGPLVAALQSLPTVRTARVDVRLPGTLAVTIGEREPVLIWQAGDHRFLVDGQGTLFAQLPAKPPAEAARLPVIDDRRSASSPAAVGERMDAVDGLAVGGRLDPVDLDAATRLASLVPADVGSSAVSLSVSVTDENGFVVETRPGSWSAVFGFYTPSLRTTEMIPGQVRLLRSLLSGRESLVDRVILASESDGTYTPRTTPSAASPKPSKAP
ncbi:MAG TPA: FtsQ-type POTRA domain-containing protein [Candidatus Limnocylindrales bacterium]